MCPNVACFCMDSEDALETSSEGGHGRPVPMQQVIIILQPIREDVVWNDTPSALPHLRHQMKRITKISKATLQFWKDDISSHQAWVSITSWPETSPHLTSESNYTVHPCMWGELRAIIMSYSTGKNYTYRAPEIILRLKTCSTEVC